MRTPGGISSLNDNAMAENSRSAPQMEVNQCFLRYVKNKRADFCPFIYEVILKVEDKTLFCFVGFSPNVLSFSSLNQFILEVRMCNFN